MALLQVQTMAAAKNNLRPESKCLLAVFMVLTLSRSKILRWPPADGSEGPPVLLPVRMLPGVFLAGFSGVRSEAAPDLQGSEIGCRTGEAIGHIVQNHATI